MARILIREKLNCEAITHSATLMSSVSQAGDVVLMMW